MKDPMVRRAANSALIQDKEWRRRRALPRARFVESSDFVGAY